jgi:tetratricopeptide (TPR) repeat protein
VDGGKANKVEVARDLLESGIEHLGNKEALRALSCFERSYELNKTAECQAYLGLCMAMERGELKRGVALCKDAVSREPENPLFYLNLGKVLMRASMKKEAIETVRKGLDFGDNDEALAWLKDIGVRRRPFFSFLPRGHFLNKYTGFFLSKIGVSGPQDPLCKF